VRPQSKIVSVVQSGNRHGPGSAGESLATDLVAGLAVGGLFAQLAAFSDPMTVETKPTEDDTASGVSAPESASAQAEINQKLSDEQKIDAYRLMIRIRRFEERSVRSYQQGKIGGFCHTYIGQEAVAAGTISVCGDTDEIITAYRDHAHALAVGMGMNELMAELYGKFSGCSKGKGGSMHFFDPEKHFWGGHGIVGGQTALGVGLAFGIKYSGKQGACLCYLGDGAVNQGVFFESMNLAGLWDIPVIYVIENNRYSMGTSQKRSSAGVPLAKRGLAFDLDYAVVENGNDYYAVREKTWEAIERAHEDSRPTVLEIQTYRYRGHSMSDPDQTYRTKDEIEDYKKTNDPIDRWAQTLIAEGVAEEEQLKKIDKEARQEAEASAAFADESPVPPERELYTDIYWEKDRAGRPAD
jgi:pyruvate dehydrogenase E1 component alpha subunit